MTDTEILDEVLERLRVAAQTVDDVRALGMQSEEALRAVVALAGEGAKLGAFIITERRKRVAAELHDALDRLAAHFVASHSPGVGLSNTSVLQLLEWSAAQTKSPTPESGSAR